MNAPDILEWRPVANLIEFDGYEGLTAFGQQAKRRVLVAALFVQAHHQEIPAIVVAECDRIGQAFDRSVKLAASTGVLIDHDAACAAVRGTVVGDGEVSSLRID